MDQGIENNSINDLSEAGTLPFDPNRVLEAEASGSSKSLLILVYWINFLINFLVLK